MTQPLLTLQHLSAGYGRRAVLREVQATLQAGELVCVLGPNGAGKSTLLRTIAGLQRPLTGSILIGQDDLHRLSPGALAQRLAIVLTERIDVDQMHVYDLVALGRQPHTNWMGTMGEADQQAIQRALEATQTVALAQHPVAQLSDGERQRVMIARALAQEPQILLLDEPTAFLDLPRRVEIMLLLRQLARDTGHACLLSTHDLDLALHVADRIWLISSAGEFAADVPEALALSGAITRIFQNEGVAFDVGSGKFNLCLPQHRVARVVGAAAGGAAALWAQRALERLGYRLSQAEDTEVQVHLPVDGVWKVQRGGATQAFASLSEVIDALNKAQTRAH